MSHKYARLANDFETHFSEAAVGNVDYSGFTTSPQHITAFNAGRLIPIFCCEILPDDTFSIDIDSVIRQTTVLTPTMGNMFIDYYAFFVPNRVVNQSFKAVMGENVKGSWIADNINLAPLLSPASTLSSIQIPVGSVADYYGIPTQAPIPSVHLKQMNDLKYRGYVMIWNEYFRDQNYQPPIPMSTLNVYQGFLEGHSGRLSVSQATTAPYVNADLGNPNDDFGENALAQSLYGSSSPDSTVALPTVSLQGRFSALDQPLLINKTHDFFTSVLPSPQKSQPVFIPVSGSVGSVPVVTSSSSNAIRLFDGALRWSDAQTGGNLFGKVSAQPLGTVLDSDQSVPTAPLAVPSNLRTASDIPVTGLAVSVDDLRMSAVLQQYAEVLSRAGSRYRSYIKAFFGIESDDPFSDIPQYLGHFRRDLDLYQTAQTSASSEGSTPQGHLSAFGYTQKGGHLFHQRFLEHGYLHIFACVRHRNLYSSYLAPDNFRLTSLDFYNPVMANISEQPVYTKYINPFDSRPDDVFGYQEPWAEYNYDQDMVSGVMRPGLGSQSLALWNYADDIDTNLRSASGNWLRSNSQAVLDRTLAVTSSNAPQLLGQFMFHIRKGRAKPVYNVPGLDIV